MQVYLVGGAIRDRLLGLAVRERDWVVVGARPADLESQGYLAVGRDFPVFLHPTTREEYALARQERKVGPGYRGFTTQFSPEVTLQEDLARRDLTINALAQPMAADGSAAGPIIDPYGGQRDLQARLLRHVSPAFIEDPVRILRTARFAARFASLGFRIADETRELMKQMVATGEADALVPERIWQETERALACERPQRFFEVLRDCGALAVIYPEIDALFGVPQPAKWHPEVDTGVHVMMVLQIAAALSDSIAVRFAALTHDLGKARTAPAHWPSHHGHEELGVPLIESMAARLRIPNECRELAVLTARHHGLVHRAFELRAATLLELLEKTDALRRPERFAQLLLACEADARGRAGLEGRTYPQADFLQQAREVAAAVVLSAAEREGLAGQAIGARLRKLRLVALEALKEQRPVPPPAI